MPTPKVLQDDHADGPWDFLAFLCPAVELCHGALQGVHRSDRLCETTFTISASTR